MKRADRPERDGEADFADIGRVELVGDEVLEVQDAKPLRFGKACDLCKVLSDPRLGVGAGNNIGESEEHHCQVATTTRRGGKRGAMRPRRHYLRSSKSCVCVCVFPAAVRDDAVGPNRGLVSGTEEASAKDTSCSPNFCSSAVAGLM